MALLHTVKLWYIFFPCRNRSISLAHKFLLMFWRLKKAIQADLLFLANANNTEVHEMERERSPPQPASSARKQALLEPIHLDVAANELVDGGLVMQSLGFGFFIKCVFQQLPYGIVWGWNGCVQSVWPVVGTVTDFVFVEWLIAVLCDVSSAGSGWNHARKQPTRSDECWPFCKAAFSPSW